MPPSFENVWSHPPPPPSTTAARPMMQSCSRMLRRWGHRLPCVPPCELPEPGTPARQDRGSASASRASCAVPRHTSRLRHMGGTSASKLCTHPALAVAESPADGGESSGALRLLCMTLQGYQARPPGRLSSPAESLAARKWRVFLSAAWGTVRPTIGTQIPGCCDCRPNRPFAPFSTVSGTPGVHSSLHPSLLLWVPLYCTSFRDETSSRLS